MQDVLFLKQSPYLGHHFVSDCAECSCGDIKTSTVLHDTLS